MAPDGKLPGGSVGGMVDSGLVAPDGKLPGVTVAEGAATVVIVDVMSCSVGEEDVLTDGVEGCVEAVEDAVGGELIVDVDAIGVVSAAVTSGDAGVGGWVVVLCIVLGLVDEATVVSSAEVLVCVDVLANVVVVAEIVVSASGGSVLLGIVGDVGVVSTVDGIGVVVVGSAVVVGIVVGDAVGDAMGDAVGDAVDGDEVTSVVKPSVVYSVVESVALYSVVL